jgi:hypothetical protein
MSKSSDETGRAMGLVVFVVGIALLAIVFKVAYTMLTNPVPGLTEVITTASTPLKPGAAGPVVAFPGVAAAIVAFVLKLLALAVLTLVGSIMSSKGIHLYFAAAGSPIGSDKPSDPLPDTLSPAPPAAPVPVAAEKRQ